MVQFHVLIIILNCMGFCHGQILIETATYSLITQNLIFLEMNFVGVFGVKLLPSVFLLPIPQYPPYTLKVVTTQFDLSA